MTLDFILQYIADRGYFALFFLSFIEGANFPIPSEPALLYSGLLVGTVGHSFWIMVLSAAIGSTIGANISYAIGRWGGRPVLYKYRKWLLLTKKELDDSDLWFDKHRIPILLISRMLPLVRTIVSFPAGIYETPFWIFNILTLIGTLIWSTILIYIGKIMGDNWNLLVPYFDKFTFGAITILILLIIWYIWHKIHKIRREDQGQ